MVVNIEQKWLVPTMYAEENYDLDTGNSTKREIRYRECQTLLICSPKTADSMPGGAIFALIEDIGIASIMMTRFSKIVLPNRKNILSGIPMAMFQRLKMIKSITDARQHVTFIKMRTFRYLHPLKNF